MFDLTGKSEFFRCLADGSRWQIEVDLVDDLTQMALHVRYDDRLCQLLSVSLVSTVVLYLDVQVQGALAAVHFLAVLVGADVLAVDLLCSPSVVLLSMAAFRVRVRDAHIV